MRGEEHGRWEKVVKEVKEFRSWEDGSGKLSDPFLDLKSSREP